MSCDRNTRASMTDILSAVYRHWDGVCPITSCCAVVVDVHALSPWDKAGEVIEDLEGLGVRCDNKSVIQVFYKVEKQGFQNA